MENFSLTLSKAQMDVIAGALVQLPYHAAAPVIDAINEQLSKQQDADMHQSKE